MSHIDKIENRAYLKLLLGQLKNRHYYCLWPQEYDFSSFRSSLTLGGVKLEPKLSFNTKSVVLNM